MAKPHRPIAAGRISLQAAQILHLLFSCSSLLLSARYGLLPHSAVYLACAAAYNDGNLARFWASKSAMIGIGLGICCWGTVVCFSKSYVVFELRTDRAQRSFRQIRAGPWPPWLFTHSLLSHYC